MGLVSFTSKRITTAGATLVTANVVTARLYANTTADVLVRIHDSATAAGTSASTKVATLFTTNPGIDELEIPVRTASGGAVVVAPAGISNQDLYLFIR